LSEQESPGNEVSGGWGAALRLYWQPKVLSMFALGFSAGLPFMLYFNTLSVWLRQNQLNRATIGMIAWVGLTYSFKFLWAPIVDRMRLPLLGATLGQRRSWMVMAQVGVAIGLIGIALTPDPATQVTQVVLFALMVSFWGATQDIAIDAWRIESSTAATQGTMAAAYQFGFRLALTGALAGALWFVPDYGWPHIYAAMAALMGIGVLTVLFVREPERRAPQVSLVTEQRVIDWLAHRRHWPQSLQSMGASFLGAVVCPLMDFFKRFGWRLGLLVFAFVATYRLTDYTMGTMANPFYVDLGFNSKQMGLMKFPGVAMTMLGVFMGGIAVTRFGSTRSLLLGSLLIIASNLAYSALAAYGHPNLLQLAVVANFDNIALGVHGTVLIAFLSTLTSASYTATQYALLSSLYSFAGKLLMGTSGFVVNALGYPNFFLYTALLTLPPLVFLYFLSSRADIGRLRPEA
jgi:PAT family beta-lactamase induction signal transducer AmpG